MEPDHLGEKMMDQRKTDQLGEKKKTDQFGNIVGRDQTPPPVQKFSLDIPAARNITILFEAER